MAMSIASGGDDDPMVDMNTTPLIDVMLVLLIMFMITLPALTHSINMQLPVHRPEPGPQHEVIQLSIDFDGTIAWNGTVVQSLEELDRHFRAAAALRDQPELHVRPDRRAKYDTVAHVLGMAQRNGLQRIGFTGQEQLLD